MAKVIIVYDSRTGNVERMANAIAEGAAGVEVAVQKVTETSAEMLLDADAIIMGSPTHFGTMTDSMKGFIASTYDIRTQLQGKIGAVFSSSAALAGGCETTMFSMIQAMLIHGMIIMGDPIIEDGGHYGAACIGVPTGKDLEVCRRLGRRIAEFIK